MRSAYGIALQPKYCETCGNLFIKAITDQARVCPRCLHQPPPKEINIDLDRPGFIPSDLSIEDLVKKYANRPGKPVNNDPERWAMRTGLVIRWMRQIQELTQNETASRMECTRPYLSRIECGKIMPTVSLIIKAARALEISPRFLVTAIDSIELDAPTPSC